MAKPTKLLVWLLLYSTSSELSGYNGRHHAAQDSGNRGAGRSRHCGPAVGWAFGSLRKRSRFATDWKAQAEHGGFYQALATGLYKNHGLDVTIRMGGPGSDTQQLLAAGAVDMALGSNSFYPINLVQAGAPVRAVMTSFQKDPQILMTHPRDDVKSIADMKGKPILISNTARSTFWIWLKAQIRFHRRPDPPLHLQHGALAPG